jgi:hypothetical protein
VIGALLAVVAGGRGLNKPGVPATPAPVTRDGARRAAQEELSKRAYHRNDPSAFDRALRWLVDRLDSALGVAARHSPGKGIGLFVIALLVVAVIVVISARVGRVRRSVTSARPILGAETTNAAQHRRRAEAFAREEQWARAVREWLRATARELEERGVLEPRPGRTADELCSETSAHLPTVTAELRRATSTFDGIWYGGHPASRDDEQLLRRVDALIAGSHRALVTQDSAMLSRPSRPSRLSGPS